MAGILRNEEEDELNKRLADLFSLRNIIEASPPIDAINLSRQIAEDVQVVITTDKNKYYAKVFSKRRECLILTRPQDVRGRETRLPEGAKITITSLIRVN